MSSQGSGSGSGSGSNSNSNGYTYTSSGTNSQGNHYCSRDYGSSASNPNPYHYSNSNGSYYYSNPNGSYVAPSQGIPRTLIFPEPQMLTRRRLARITTMGKETPNTRRRGANRRGSVSVGEVVDAASG